MVAPSNQMLRFVFDPLCGLLASTAQAADTKPSIGRQFIDGHNSITFSILAPFQENEAKVETVSVRCDAGKCGVRIMRISQRACEGGSVHKSGGSSTYDELIQTEEHGPEEQILAPKVTPGDDNMLLVQYEDGGRDVRLRVRLTRENSVWQRDKQFILVGGVVGEEELGFQTDHPQRFAPITEIVGSAVICRARFLSR
jgi:hypothetical protein